MDDLTSFVPDGARLLEAVFGDLDGDGRPDALLVLESPRADRAVWGQCPPREVVLLIRDDSGVLCRVASNDCLVPGATSGGLVGDPFGYAAISPGSFTIVNGGGGRRRWWDEFAFTYVPDRRDWFVSRVTRFVADTHTGEERRIEWVARDLEVTPFSKFDPSQLPEVALP